MALSRSLSPGALQDPPSDQQSIEAEEAEDAHSGRQSPNLDSENSPFISPGALQDPLSDQQSIEAEEAEDAHSGRQSPNLDTENSPFISPEGSDFGENLIQDAAAGGVSEWHEDGQESKSVLYLVLLTLSMGGLQVAYGAEMSNGSPYLLSLGLDKSMLAFVWIAGPLSGTLIQPYIGIQSDNSRMAWGKRKPFMLAGAIATALSFLTLAWAREIVQTVLGIFGADPKSHGVRVSAMVFAIIIVYILDVAINTVQAAIRAFIVDNAPTHQQEDANAWAGRMTGVGNIVGYIAGYVDLPKRSGGFLGNTQFKVLCVISSIALCGTVLVSISFIRERDPRPEGPAPSNRGILSFFRQVIRSTKRLPPQIRRVCEAQFFSWISWFPFLFYITTYIGQIYLNPYFEANPDLSEDEIEKAWEGATRIGTFALLMFAITSFTSSLLLPFFVAPTYQHPHNLNADSSSFQYSAPHSHHLDDHHSQYTSGPSSTHMTSSFSLRPESPTRLSRILSACQIRWLTLRRAWMLSQFLIAFCMMMTFFITNTTAATILTGTIGLPWALSLWAPFALISAEISKRDAEARRSGSSPPEDQAGVILGLHNVAISAPQILATLVSSGIFKLTQKPRGSAGDDSVGWVLRFGGCAALLAALFTWRIGEEGAKGREKVVDQRNEA